MATASNFIQIKNYRLDFPHIGKGAFGIVYRGRDNDTGKTIAAKNVQYKEQTETLNEDNEDLFKMNKKEGEILQKLNGHKNIVNLIDFFDADSCHWFIMEFCELGDLPKYMKTQAVNLHDKIKIMVDVSSGLSFMHSIKPPVIHRDIKPENVLMKFEDGRHRAKLSDFGLGKLFEADTSHFTMMSGVGTWGFMAPEFYIDTGYVQYQPGVDTFALGLLYSVVLLYDKKKHSGMTPISVESRKSQMHIHYGLEMKNAHKDKAPMPELFEQNPEADQCVRQLQEIITQMTQFHESDRLSVQQVKMQIMELHYIMVQNDFHTMQNELEKVQTDYRQLQRKHKELQTPPSLTATINNPEMNHVEDTLFEEALKSYQQRTAGIANICLTDYMQEEQIAWNHFICNAEGNVERKYRKKWQIEIDRITRNLIDFKAYIDDGVENFRTSKERHTSDKDLFMRNQDHYLVRMFMLIYKQQVENRMKETKAVALENASDYERGNLYELFDKISSSDIADYDAVAHSFSEWEPRRIQTMQSLEEIQVKVNGMNEPKASGGNTLQIVMSVAETILFGSLSLHPLSRALVGLEARIAKDRQYNFTAVLDKLGFHKLNAEEIKQIVEVDRKQTETFFAGLNSKINYWDTSEKHQTFENLSAIGVVVHHIGQVFGEFIEMLENLKPKQELSQYLAQKQNDLQKDLQLLSSICTYLMLHQLHLSVSLSLKEKDGNLRKT